jgi:hypothetical protein
VPQPVKPVVLERREEALIELAQERGIDLLRRPHADPCAVLGVRLVAGKD